MLHNQEIVLKLIYTQTRLFDAMRLHWEFGSKARTSLGGIQWSKLEKTGAWGSMNIDLEQLKKTQLYSEELGIDLAGSEESELFKWFLASLLFGARITEKIAKNTYRAFERHKLLTPQNILKAGWDYLVNPIMAEGGYVRYDGRKSDQILRDCATLLNLYNGSLNKLHQEAKDSKDLEQKLLEFYGVGPITVNIFLRELRPYWQKADPEPLPVVRKMARKFKIRLSDFDRKSIEFVRIEAGLIRLRRSLGQPRRSISKK